ncbi:Cytochrome c oxidase subunit 6A, mitochondrial [Acarospora aff. strigata]|nr:Cytochrome c oxidase subunit 6A, mitochondrial [Acarospora aff. strigata]
MIPQRTILRASERAGQPLRSPVLRSTIQRRFASGEGVKLTGPADNAFNRERQAVKQHAAATSGAPLAEAINLVNFATDSKCREKSTDLQRPSVTIPCLIIASVNAYNLWTEHWEHWAHEPPLEERPEYPYQNIRTKNYIWKDGDKTLL